MVHVLVFIQTHHSTLNKLRVNLYHFDSLFDSVARARSLSLFFSVFICFIRFFFLSRVHLIGIIVVGLFYFLLLAYSLPDMFAFRTILSTAERRRDRTATERVNT